jgi:hypothetical protein
LNRTFNCPERKIADVSFDDFSEHSANGVFAAESNFYDIIEVLVNNPLNFNILKKINVKGHKMLIDSIKVI